MKIARDQRRVFIGEIFDCRISTPQGVARFKAQVDSVAQKELYVKAPASYAQVLAKGQTVMIVFVRPGKAFRFSARILDIRRKGDALMLGLTGTTTVEQIERRQHMRKLAKGSLEFRTKVGSRPITYHGKLVNVSEGGIMFTTMFGGMFAPGSKPVGKEIQLDLTVLSHKLPNLSGQVVHAFAHPKLREIVAVNLKWTDVPAGIRRRISDILFRLRD